jgi:nucleotide-binding universal stress UspA family protein
MIRTVLAGYDDSDQARDALAFARLIVGATGARLVVAGILPQDPLTGGRDVLFADSDAQMQHAVERAAAPTGATALTVPAGSAAHGLHELGEELDADLIVVGSSHRGRIGRALAGTVAQRLLHGASCAVAVVPRGYRDTEHELRAIAVGYDGGLESKEALGAAVALSEKTGASLHLLTAVYPPALGDLRAYGYPTTAYAQALREHYESEHEAALEAIPASVNADGKLLGDEITEVVPAMLSEVDGGIDLLCIGSRSYGPVRRVLLGSVSSRLAKETPCPLLVVPRGVREDAAGQNEAVSAVLGST